MTPRVHNGVSYAGALVAMPAGALVGWDRLGSFPWVLVALWALHFVRRLVETLWVHRYSKSRFPWGDALVEYLYYWGFGSWIGYQSASFEHLGPLAYAGLLLFALAELGNARAHRLLRGLRTDDPTARAIPHGFAFEWVSCPHYLFEILTWIGFSLVAQSWAAFAFTTVGAAILIGWATARHKAYQKDFDGQSGRARYPASRKALVPFLY